MTQKILVGILFLTGIIPIISSDKLFFSAISTKTITFAFLITLVSIIFCIKFLRNRQFKLEIIQKINHYASLMEVKFLLGFVGISLISVIFAHDKYIAFWGNFERGYGFVNLITLVIFLFFVLLLFKKQDWIRFLKIQLVVATIVLGKLFYQFFLLHDGRPGSFFENPAFLSGYFLFIIAFSGIVFSVIKNVLWKYLSVIIGTLSIISILITETRGAMVGLFLGFLGVVIYGTVYGKNHAIRNFSVRNISLGILISGIVFIGCFFVTKDAQIWQKIPGMSRIAMTNQQDNTTLSRLLIWRSGLQSVNPKEHPKEFIIGWGVENANLALNEYYNPLIYRQDDKNFDRAHNQFIDHLIMTGIIGLIVYIGFLFFLIKRIVAREYFSLESAFVLFGVISFLGYLMFIFDHPTTSLNFSILISFVLGFYKNNHQEKDDQNLTKTYIFIGTIILLIFVNIRGNGVSFFQMRSYAQMVQGINQSTIEKFPKVLIPFSPAQSNIRKNILETSVEIFDQVDNQKLFMTAQGLLDIAISAGDEYIVKRPQDFRILTLLAGAYNKKYEITDDIVYLKRSEQYMRKSLEFAPERQELNNNLIFNLMHQGRFEEAIVLADANIARDELLAEPYYYKAMVLFMSGKDSYSDALVSFEESFELNNEVFSERKLLNFSNYGKLLDYFYKKRDKNRTFQIIDRLIINEYPQSDQLENLKTYIDRGVWPRVEFK